MTSVGYHKLQSKGFFFLGAGRPTLQGTRDLGSLTRDWTRVPCTESAKSSFVKGVPGGESSVSVLYSRPHKPQPHRQWGLERKAPRFALQDVQNSVPTRNPLGARISSTTMKLWQSKGVQTWLGVLQKVFWRHPFQATNLSVLGTQPASAFSSHLQGPSPSQSEFRDALTFSTKCPDPFQPTQTLQALHVIVSSPAPGLLWYWTTKKGLGAVRWLNVDIQGDGSPATDAQQADGKLKTMAVLGWYKTPCQWVDAEIREGGGGQSRLVARASLEKKTGKESMGIRVRAEQARD